MDEQSEAFIKLIGYMLIAPFWLAWKVCRFAWQLQKPKSSVCSAGCTIN